MKDDYRSYLESVSRRGISPEVRAFLSKLNLQLPEDSSRLQSLSKLEQDQVLCVCTGQQLGLLGGPLYTLIKALDAVSYARVIERESGIPTVPIFWQQSEDHDFEEIKRMHLLPSGDDAPVLELKTAHNAHCAVGPLMLGEEDVQHLRSEAEAVLAAEPYGPDVLELLIKLYRPGASLSQAFRELFAEFTAGTGLLFFDSRASGASELFQDVFKRALEEFQALSAALLSRSKEIKSSKVHVRAESPLFFIHPESPEGPRYRAEWDRDAEVFKLIGGNYTLQKSELQTLIEQSPAQLSSSALLRPILQDSLFPTGLFIGGDAELEYFRQILPLYEFFELPTPYLCSRRHLWVFDEKQERWLKEIGLDPEALLVPSDRLVSVLASSMVSDSQKALDAREAEIQRGLESLLAPLETEFTEIDESLRTPVERTKSSTIHAVGKLFEKARRRAIAGEEVQLKRVNKLHSQLQLAGAAQERAFGISAFVARYGLEFVSRLLEFLESPTLNDVYSLGEQPREANSESRWDTFVITR